MVTLKMILITVGMMILVIAGLSVKMFFKKGGEFTGGACKNRESKIITEVSACQCGEGAGTCKNLKKE